MTIIRLWHEGDSSVGIGGDEATVKLDTSHMDDEEMYYLLDLLKHTFATLWDFRVHAEVLDEEEMFDAALEPAG